MEDHLLVAHGFAERVVVGEVAVHQTHATLGERGRARGGANQRGHLVAGVAEQGGEVAAHEAGRPGDQRLHVARSRMR